MSTWIRSNWIMLTVIAAIFIAAAVLLIVGLLTHREAGLMGVCWGADGTVERYLDAPTDDCPAVRWDGLPLRVKAMSNNPSPPDDPERAARRAIETINERLGFELLRYEEDGLDHCMEAHAVCIRIGEPRQPRWMETAGDTMHFRGSGDGEPLYCEVRTSNTGTIELLDLVLEHEIYHCLGLAHDDFDSSIMRSTPMAHVPDGQFPPRLTDSDRDLLRALYAP